MPIAYADPDTMDYLPSSPGSYDDEVEPVSEEPEIPPPPKQGHGQIVLGFQPPPDRPMAGVRARKSKSRKAVLRSMGADG